MTSFFPPAPPGWLFAPDGKLRKPNPIKLGGTVPESVVIVDFPGMKEYAKKAS
jgi:hypothetical protein